MPAKFSTMLPFLLSRIYMSKRKDTAATSRENIVFPLAHVNTAYSLVSRNFAGADPVFRFQAKFCADLLGPLKYVSLTKSRGKKTLSLLA